MMMTRAPFLDLPSNVITGLDPVIARSWAQEPQARSRRAARAIAGSSPAMTTWEMASS